MSVVASRMDDAGIISLTPSKVREYQTCPHQYKLKTLERKGFGGSSPSLSFGSSLHAALEELHNPLLGNEHPADLEQVLRRHWKSDGYCDAREADLYFDRGLEALTRYVQAMGQPSGRVVGTEVFLSRTIRFDSILTRVGCKVDRLELHENGVLEALDYKTILGRVPTRESLSVDLATFIYYLLTRLSYPKHPRVIVSQLNVLTLAKVEVEYDSALLSVNKQALVTLVHEIEAGAFEPRPSSTCAWCPVKEFCPIFGTEANLNDLI